MKNTEIKSIETVLKEQPFLIRPIKGDSMMPMLDEKTDTVKLVSVSGTLSAGDLPLYRRPGGKLVLHRIVEVGKGFYITRGDNRENNEKISAKWVIAVAEGFYKKGSYISVNDEKYKKYVNEIIKHGKPELDLNIRYLLELYRSAINNTAPPPPPEWISWHSVLKICRQNSITGAVCNAIEKLDEKPPQEIFKAFLERKFMAVKRDLLFCEERKKICLKLDEHRIPYILLKGIHLGKYYYYKGMREYADNDILYKPQYRQQMQEIMTELGYQMTNVEIVHDVYKKKPIFNFEIHKNLFADNSPYSEYFSDIWNMALPPDTESSYEYKMNDEDFYLHHIAHYAKHYNLSGAGLRSLGDFYLLQTALFKKPELDREYIKNGLKKLKLEAFSDKITMLVKNLFENDIFDGKSLSNIIFSGTFGTLESLVNKSVGQRGKIRHIAEHIFYPADILIYEYPYLKKHPGLVPAFWVLRVFRKILNKTERANALKHLKLLKKV